MVERDYSLNQVLERDMLTASTNYLFMEAADIYAAQIPFDELVATEQTTMVSDLVNYFRRFQHHFVYNEQIPLKSKYPYYDVDHGVYQYQKELMVLQSVLPKDEHLIAGIYCKVTCKDSSYKEKLIQAAIDEGKMSSLEYWIDTITVISVEEAKQFYDEMLKGNEPDGKLLYMKYADGYFSPGYHRTFNIM